MPVYSAPSPSPTLRTNRWSAFFVRAACHSPFTIGTVRKLLSSGAWIQRSPSPKPRPQMICTFSRSSENSEGLTVVCPTLENTYSLVRRKSRPAPVSSTASLASVKGIRMVHEPSTIEAVVITGPESSGMTSRGTTALMVPLGSPSPEKVCTSSCCVAKFSGNVGQPITGASTTSHKCRACANLASAGSSSCGEFQVSPTSCISLEWSDVCWLVPDPEREEFSHASDSGNAEFVATVPLDQSCSQHAITGSSFNPSARGSHDAANCDASWPTPELT